MKSNHIDPNPPLLAIIQENKKKTKSKLQLSRLLLPKAKVPPLHPETVVKRNSSNNVNNNVRPEDSKVPPPFIPANIHPGQELIRFRHGAELAPARRISVIQVSRCDLEVVGQVLAAGLVGRWVEDGHLDVAAYHIPPVEHCCGSAANPVGEWGHAVHEDPEAGEGVGGLHDTVEGQREGEEEGDDGTGGFGIRKSGNDHIREGACVDEELDEEKEDETLASGGLHAHNGIVVASVNEHTHEDLVRNFDEDSGKHERLPAVRLAGSFADFIQSALSQEERDNLLDEGREDGTDHEEGEDSVLETLG